MTQTGMFVGTVDYIAPEQVEGRRVDARADVYALGCVAYELLSGNVPFPRESGVAKIFAHVNDPPPRLQDLPEPLTAAVRRAMAKRPEDRFLSAGDFGRALSAGAANRIISDGDRTVATGAAAIADAHAPTELDEYPSAALGRGNRRRQTRRLRDVPSGRPQPSGRVGAGSCRPAPPRSWPWSAPPLRSRSARSARARRRSPRRRYDAHGIVRDHEHDQHGGADGKADLQPFQRQRRSRRVGDKEGERHVLHHLERHQRTDAYRCTVGNALYDPCFSVTQSELLCLLDGPWANRGILLNVGSLPSAPGGIRDQGTSGQSSSPAAPTACRPAARRTRSRVNGSATSAQAEWGYTGTSSAPVPPG